MCTYDHAKPSADDETQTLRNQHHQPTDEREHDEPVPFQRLSGHQVNDHGKYQTPDRLKRKNTFIYTLI